MPAERSWTSLRLSQPEAGLLAAFWWHPRLLCLWRNPLRSGRCACSRTRCRGPSWLMGDEWTPSPVRCPHLDGHPASTQLSAFLGKTGRPSVNCPSTLLLCDLGWSVFSFRARGSAVQKSLEEMGLDKVIGSWLDLELTACEQNQKPDE